MKNVKPILLGFFGAALAIALWFLGTTAYLDHQRLTGLWNWAQAQEQAKVQQMKPAPAPEPSAAPAKEKK